MGIKTVAILSPGDMGSATGKMLHDHGLDVVTCLEGRSELTLQRAREAGFRIVPSYDDLVHQAELILSILPPSEAVALAEEVGGRLQATGSSLVYADFNAIAPQTAQSIDSVIRGAGGQFVDGGIIGSPPGPGAQPRFYCSGPDVSTAMELGNFGLDVRNLGDKVGQASGLKMVYAASTKGTTALWIELMVAAHKMGLYEALAHELEGSTVYAAMRNNIPTVPRRSRRWIGEMEEIAAAFESQGLTPDMLLGAAEMYRLVGKTQMASSTSHQPAPTFDETIQAIVEQLDIE